MRLLLPIIQLILRLDIDLKTLFQNTVDTHALHKIYLISLITVFAKPRNRQNASIHPYAPGESTHLHQSLLTCALIKKNIVSMVKYLISAKR